MTICPLVTVAGSCLFCGLYCAVQRNHLEKWLCDPLQKALICFLFLFVYLVCLFFNVARTFQHLRTCSNQSANQTDTDIQLWQTEDHDVGMLAFSTAFSHCEWEMRMVFCVWFSVYMSVVRA